MLAHSVCADCVRVVFDSLQCTMHVIFFNFNFVVMRIEEDIRHLKVRTWRKTPQRGQQLPVILASDKRQKRRVNDNSFLISFAVFSTRMRKPFQIHGNYQLRAVCLNAALIVAQVAIECNLELSVIWRKICRYSFFLFRVSAVIISVCKFIGIFFLLLKWSHFTLYVTCGYRAVDLMVHMSCKHQTETATDKT